MKGRSHLCAPTTAAATARPPACPRPSTPPPPPRVPLRRPSLTGRSHDGAPATGRARRPGRVVVAGGRLDVLGEDAEANQEGGPPAGPGSGVAAAARPAAAAIRPMKQRGQEAVLDGALPHWTTTVGQGAGAGWADDQVDRLPLGAATPARWPPATSCCTAGSVDADTADRGHGVGSVAYSRPPRPEPAPQPVDLDLELAHVVPGPQRLPVAQERHQTGDGGAEAVQAGLAEARPEGALGDHVRRPASTRRGRSGPAGPWPGQPAERRPVGRPSR